MSDYVVHEINSEHMTAPKKNKPKVVEPEKKKKKKKLKEDSSEQPKKKKKKLSTSDVGSSGKKKKKKKLSSSDGERPKKKKKNKSDASGGLVVRSRASILGQPEKLKERKKKKKKKTVNKESETSNLPSTVGEDSGADLAAQFDNVYGDKIEQLSVEDREQMQEYFTMFRKLQLIARRFEDKSVTGSSKDVYALMKVYDQMREIIADLKALKDIAAIADKLQEDVLLPYTRVSVQEFSNYRANILKVATRLLPTDKISEFRKELDSGLVLAAQNLEASYDAARASIVDMYSEG